ncbi:SDR family NAD(P)-dependent oxidoreductase [Paenibacillus radicis (ex Xue et al. 2023)]|uniref:SDR family NAD(P)-dependent oxidoreductase n=1 Tax=Paenibacillus radicis (ex Xue et al. 2023) TaxID=2972489 RepID=UPI003AF322C8
MAKSKNIDYFEFDLNNVDEIDLVIEKAFSKVDEQNAEGIYLINNAAVISPLGRIEQGSVKDFKNNLHVNLLAPILLTSSFIRNSQHIRGEKRVLNVSSMSAKNHLPGMSVYSASKAGLDVFRNVSVLNKVRQNPL